VARPGGLVARPAGLVVHCLPVNRKVVGSNQAASLSRGV